MKTLKNSTKPIFDITVVSGVIFQRKRKKRFELENSDPKLAMQAQECLVVLLAYRLQHNVWLALEHSSQIQSRAHSHKIRWHQLFSLEHILLLPRGSQNCSKAKCYTKCTTWPTLWHVSDTRPTSVRHSGIPKWSLHLDASRSSCYIYINHHSPPGKTKCTNVGGTTPHTHDARGKQSPCLLRVWTPRKFFSRTCKKISSITLTHALQVQRASCCDKLLPQSHEK